MTDPVRAMYDANAASYDKMVEAEIDLPVYTRAFTTMAAAIGGLAGPVVDVACGSGQMLQRYGDGYDPKRELVGIDLSPAMVGITRPKLRPPSQVRVGDMRSPGVRDAAALICWFALHHLDESAAAGAFVPWLDALAPGGLLSLATWEGRGLLDYGDAADIEAWRYTAEQVRDWAEQAGFVVQRCAVEPVEGMGMDAVYLDAVRPRR